MSVALYIVAEKDPGVNMMVNGKALGHADPEEIEGLCKSANVRPLMEFCSQNPDEMDAFLEEDF